MIPKPFETASIEQQVVVMQASALLYAEEINRLTGEISKLSDKIAWRMQLLNEAKARLEQVRRDAVKLAEENS